MVDISAPSLAGLGLGERRDAIETQLGPSRSVLGVRRGHLDYGHLGVVIRLEAGGLVGFNVHVSASPGDPWDPYQGFWLPGHRQSPPELDEVRQLMGEPQHTDEDEDGLSLFWQRRALINVDFDPKGKLTDLWVDFDGSL